MNDMIKLNKFDEWKAQEKKAFKFIIFQNDS